MLYDSHSFCPGDGMGKLGMMPPWKEIDCRGLWKLPKLGGGMIGEGKAGGKGNPGWGVPAGEKWLN